MQPPLLALLLCWLLLACLLAMVSQSFIITAAPPKQPLLQRRILLSTERRPIPSIVALAAAAAADNDWPSDSSDMEDTSEDADAAGTESAAAVVDVEAREATIQELEQELLLLLVGNNRGFNVQEKEREAVDEAITLLEGENPTPKPTEGFATRNSPLSGEWRLIYTNAVDVLLLGLLPTVVLGRVYQNIGPDGTEITNIAELQPGLSQLGLFPVIGRLGDSVARLRVEAASTALSATRQSLTFKSARFEPVTLFGIDVTAQLPKPKFDFVNSPNVGYIETTFVNERIRIGRSPGGPGRGGSVFVFVRER